MKKGIIIMFFLINIAFVSADFNIDKTYNITELPLIDSAGINLSLIQNESIYISPITINPYVTFNYPDEINLSNSSVAELIFEYNIAYLDAHEGNETILSNVFGLTNSYNSNLVLANVDFTIKHPELIDEEEDYNQSIELEDGGKLVTIRTYSGIEFNQSHKITVKAPNGAFLKVTCGEFITCQENVTIVDSNQEDIYVDVFVGENELPGNYTSYVNLTRGNTSMGIKFKIVIAGGNLYNAIMYDVFDPECYESVENLAKCYQKQARYNAEVAQQLINQLESEGCSCKNITRVNETIKYVEVGNIDPALLDSYEALRKDYNKLSNDYSALTTKHQRCIDSKVELEEEVSHQTSSLSDDFILKRNELEKEVLEEKEKVTSTLKSKLLWVFGIFAIIMYLFAIVGHYMKESWMIPNFPTKIMLIVAVIFTGIYLIVMVSL